MSKFEHEYDDAYEEARYHTKKGLSLLFKTILTLVLFGFALTALTMLVKPAFLYGERIITKTSFQYTEGKAQEMLTLNSDYQGLGSRIAQAYANGQTKVAQAMELQRAAIKTQMCNIAQQATTQSAIPAPVRSVCKF